MINFIKNKIILFIIFFIIALFFIVWCKNLIYADAVCLCPDGSEVGFQCTNLYACTHGCCGGAQDPSGDEGIGFPGNMGCSSLQGLCACPNSACSSTNNPTPTPNGGGPFCGDGSPCPGNDCSQCPACTGGASYGACGGASLNTCANGNGIQTVYLSQPQACTNSSYNQRCTVDNCTQGFNCVGGACSTTVAGVVYIDINRNGQWDTGEPRYSNYGKVHYGDATMALWNNDTGVNVQNSTAIGGTGGDPLTGQGLTPSNAGSYYFYNVPSEGYGGNYYIKSQQTPNDYEFLTTPLYYTPLTAPIYDANFALTPLNTVTGTVYEDFNHNGILDAEDIPYTGDKLTVGVKLTGAQIAEHDVNDDFNTGNFNFTGILNNISDQDNYTISITTIPSDVEITKGTDTAHLFQAYPQTLQGSQGMVLMVAQLYKVKGAVFFDVAEDGHFHIPCSNPDPNKCDYATDKGSITITSKETNKTYNANLASDGSFDTGMVLPAGDYVVDYSAPTGYKATSITPEEVTVGTPNKSIACNPGPYNNDAKCDSVGDIINLDFGITNNLTSYVGICTNQRFDNGISDSLPQSPGSTNACGSYSVNGVSYNMVDSYANICTNNSLQSGIVYSGNQNPFFGYNNGQASIPNWQVGDTTYPETFNPVEPGVIQTSYAYLKGVAVSSGIDLTVPSVQLSNYCDLSNCSLPANLSSGIYVANSDVNLNSFTFPSDKYYVFLINGNLTLKGNILIPTGSDAAFATTGNIYVSPLIGESDYTSGNANIEGLYTTDKSFIIESSANANAPCNLDGSPIDLRLNIVGSVIVNASNTGGAFTNNRDLCTDDQVCPTFTVGFEDGSTGDPSGVGGQRPGAGNGLSYILNAPDFIFHKNTFFQEVNP